MSYLKSYVHLLQATSRLLPPSPRTPSSVSLAPNLAATTKRFLITRFNFDTYKLVRHLERQGFTRGQSVAIMRCINALLVDSTLSIRSKLLSKSELENESFAYKAALSDLRQELSQLRQNDTQQLRSDAEQVLREVETIQNLWQELLATLKGELSMDISNRKSETREHAKATELKIQDVQHNLVIKLSELKTLIERYKMDITKTLGWVAMSSFGCLFLLEYVFY